MKKRVAGLIGVILVSSAVSCFASSWEYQQAQQQDFARQNAEMSNRQQREVEERIDGDKIDKRHNWERESDDTLRHQRDQQEDWQRQYNDNIKRRSW